MPCAASSVAHWIGSTFCAVLTAWAIGFAPPPMMSFSVTSTSRPRFAGIIASAACFAVMMREVSPCRNIASALLQIRLPEETVRLQQRIFARHAVDDDVEAVVGAEDPAEQRGDLALARVIDAHGDRGAAGGLDQRRGFVDGLGPPVRRRLAGDAAARAVDGRAGFGEGASDAAACTAGGAGHEGDASGQRRSRRFLPRHSLADLTHNLNLVCGCLRGIELYTTMTKSAACRSTRERPANDTASRGSVVIFFRARR